MKKYVEVFGAVSPSAGAVSRAGDIVAALAPPPATSHAMVPASHTVGATVKSLVPGAVGAAIGAFAWKKHPVLGLVMGFAVGDNAMELWKGDRTKAVCKLAVEGAGVVGALKFKKHPVLGFIGGALAGAVATSFVDGSPAKDAWKKLKG
jgi:hypothetical protein